MATKTGGGLLGRADSTLVQGALKAELANIAPDMRGVYKMQAENVTNLQTAVQDFFYAFDKSNNDLENEVKELTPKLLADIETGTYIDDSYVDLVSQEINSLRQQMKLIPKGIECEAERAKIKTKLANIKAESGSAEQTMTKIATLIDNDQIDFNSLQTGDMELWKSILNKTAKREFVDGKLVYSANINGKELKISHSDLEKRFLPKQYGVQSNALKLSNGFINVGKQGLEYDFNGAMNAYETLMTNKQEVLGLINNPFGSMQYSFKDALKRKDPNLTKELISALNNVGGFDVDNDGTPDQITMSNLNKLVSTLTNPDDENFNLATTKRIAAAFYADNDGRIQYNKGKSLFDAKTDTDSNNKNSFDFSGVQLLNGQYMSPGNAETLRDNVLEGRSFNFKDPTNKEISTYDFVNKNWYENYKEGDYENSDSYIGSADDLMFGFTNDKRFQGLKTKKTVDPFSGQVKEPELTLIQTKNDDDAASNLNNFFSLANKDYKFVPYYRTRFIDRVIGFADSGIAKDDATTNDIMLVDKNGNPYTKDDVVVRFKTGKNANEDTLKTIVTTLVDLGIDDAGL